MKPVRLPLFDLGDGFVIDGRGGAVDRRLGVMNLGSGMIETVGGVVKLHRGFSKMIVDFLMRSAGVIF